VKDSMEGEVSFTGLVIQCLEVVILCLEVGTFAYYYLVIIRRCSLFV